MQTFKARAYSFDYYSLHKHLQIFLLTPWRVFGLYVCKQISLSNRTSHFVAYLPNFLLSSKCFG